MLRGRLLMLLLLLLLLVAFWLGTSQGPDPNRPNPMTGG
jgi:hypothetical protein